MTMALPSLLGGSAMPQQAPMQVDLDNPEKAISQLKTIRNSVIGSRTHKSNLVHTGVIEQLVQLLRTDLDSTIYASDLVSLSATIVASLANTPAQSTLLQLMRSSTHDALLCCLRNLTQKLSRSKRHVLDRQSDPFDALKILESILRALRSILLAVADQLSVSPRWGIGLSWGTKATTSGTSITRLGFNASASKVFGKSARNSSSAAPTPIQDILMSSASQDNLRAKVKQAQPETEAQQQRELRRLSRVFLARVYEPSNLALLLGPLFMCPIPQQQGSTARLASATASPRAPSPSTTDPHPASSAPAATSSQMHHQALELALDVESLPMTVKSKILSVVEMICAILSGTMFIPGWHADAKSATSRSLAEQIAERRESILAFSASDSPFAPGFNPEASPRGRSEIVSDSHNPPQMQAQIIRKGSRSRSRMKNADNAGTFDAPPLPPWDEDGSDQLHAASNLAVHGSPSVLTVLLAAAECGFSKTQEAALYCLAEITRDEPEASLRLFRCTSPSGMLPTSVLLNLRQTSSANVRLAAFCCLANIIKVHPFTAKTNQCVLEVLMELLDHAPPDALRTSSAASVSHLQGSSQVEMQIQAAFAISRLVADNVALQTLAADSYNALSKLAQLLDVACTRSQVSSGNKVERVSATTTVIGSIAVSTPRTDATVGVQPPTIDEAAIRLREACLTALAALTFQHDEPRRKLIDTVQPPVLAMVVSSISFPALGVRVAACRLTRALSRSLSILRTSIVDAGVAPKLVALLQDPDEEEVVKVEAAAAICNLVLDFSPMKKLIQELGGVDTLVQLAHGSDQPRTSGSDEEEEHYSLSAATTLSSTSTPCTDKGRSSRAVVVGLSGSKQLRLHALWALKNLLSHSDTALKTDVMSKLEFSFIASICESSTCEMAFKEQALNILRNAAASKETDVTFMVDGMGGGERLMQLLEKCIWDGREAGEPGAAVIEQAAFVLVNVATGTEQHRKLILRTPNIMDALAFFCNHPWKDIRVAAARCIGNLVSRSKASGSVSALDAATQADAGFTAAIVEEDIYPDLHTEARARIARFGLDTRMRELAQSDTELDVRERAISALTKLWMTAKSS